MGNPATNVIPARAAARLNIRFNPTHTGDALAGWIEQEVRTVEGASGLTIELTTLHSGDAFLTEPGPFVELVLDTAEEVLGRRPEPNTKGGTSDARFIRPCARWSSWGWSAPPSTSGRARRRARPSCGCSGSTRG